MSNQNQEPQVFDEFTSVVKAYGHVDAGKTQFLCDNLKQLIYKSRNRPYSNISIQVLDGKVANDE